MPTKNEISEFLGVPLPSYALDPHFTKERGMAYFAYFKCRIPVERLESFLKVSPMFPQALDRSNAAIVFGSYNAQSSWWSPQDVKAPRYGAKRGTRGTWRTQAHLMVDIQEAFALVYLVHFEEP